jgi:hypothetical protein
MKSDLELGQQWKGFSWSIMIEKLFGLQLPWNTENHSFILILSSILYPRQVHPKRLNMLPFPSNTPNTGVNPSIPVRKVVHFTPYERKGVIVSCEDWNVIYYSQGFWKGYGRSWRIQLRAGCHITILYNFFCRIPLAQETGVISTVHEEANSVSGPIGYIICMWNPPHSMFIICLLASDLLQSIAGITQMKWAIENQIHEGHVCSV